MQNHIKWFLKEVPDLIEKGLIDDRTGQSLTEHYKKFEDKKGLNLTFIITGILGAILIGIGIISIFASNWDEFSKPVRTVLSFLPMIIAQFIFGYAFFKKRDSIAWTESTSAFLMLTLASSLALISQTYNISGSMEAFILTWMILSIPLMYLTNSSLVTIFYLVGIAYWGFVRGLIQFPGNGIFYWLLLLAALPHILMNVRKGATGIREVILSWTLVLSFTFAMAGVIEMEIVTKLLISISVFSILFYLIGKNITFEGKSIWTRPFQTAAILVIFITLLFLSYDLDINEKDFKEVISGHRFPAWVAHLNWAIIIASFLASVYMTLKRVLKNEYVNPFVLAFPIVVLLYLTLELYFDSPLSIVPANLLLLGWGIYYMRKGIKQKQIGLVNAGMLFLCMIVALRFFDPGISFVIKGIVFIILGSGFLITNYVLSKRLIANE